MDPQDDDSSSTASEESIPYSPSTPYIIDLEYDNGKSYEYEALFSKELVDFGPSFQLPQSVNATPEALCELFLPDSLLDRWVVCTNDYAASHLPPARHYKNGYPPVPVRCVVHGCRTTPSQSGLLCQGQ